MDPELIAAKAEAEKARAEAEAAKAELAALKSKTETEAQAAEVTRKAEAMAAKGKVIDKARAEGRIVGDLVQAVETVAASMDVAGLEAFVSSLPVQTRPQASGHSDSNDGVPVPDLAAMSLAKKLGLDPKYLKAAEGAVALSQDGKTVFLADGTEREVA